jgi:dihydrofolate reductase
MGDVIVSAAVSLDGFIAYTDNTVGPLFDWYGNGDVAIAPGDPDREFRVTPQTAEYLRSWSSIGAQVSGRTLFDFTNGWDGRPPAGEHVFIVTHEAPSDWGHDDAPFTFVTDGVGSAIAQAKAYAGDRDVSVSAGDIAGQALAAGLVDELRLDLVPVVLGAGVRYFGSYDGATLRFGDPEVVQGLRVTHLRYRRTA